MKPGPKLEAKKLRQAADVAAAKAKRAVPVAEVVAVPRKRAVRKPAPRRKK